MLTYISWFTALRIKCSVSALRSVSNYVQEITFSYLTYTYIWERPTENSESYLMLTHISWFTVLRKKAGRVAQSVGHLTRKSGVLGSIPGLATYFRFSFRFFKKGSCQLLAKVCARSTG